MCAHHSCLPCGRSNFSIAGWFDRTGSSTRNHHWREQGSGLIESENHVARRPGAWLAALLVAGALVRLGLWWWWQQNTTLTGDEVDYDGIATRLVEQHQYVSSNGEPNSLRPPLYPAMVASIYTVAGLHNFSAVRLVQVLISLLTVVQVYRLGLVVASQSVALLAAAIFCFYPPVLGFNNLILTETLFTFFFLSTAVSTSRFVAGGNSRDMVMAAVWCGLGALTRSALFFYAPILAVYVLVFARAPVTRRLLATGLFIVVFAVILAPWTIRNTRLQKTFTTVDCMGGRNLMMGNYEYTPMERTWATIDIHGEHAWYTVLAKEHPNFAELTQGQRDKAAMRYGLEYIKAHPWLTLQRDIRKFFHFWQLERTLIAGAKAGRFGPIPKPLFLVGTAVLFAAQALLFIAAIYGGFLLAPERRYHWLLLLMMALLCAMHSLIFGHSRYHLPLIPLIAIYAAIALLGYRDILGRRRNWRFWLASLASLVLVASWLYEIFILDFSRFMQSKGRDRF